MDNKITAKRINDHLEYDWFKYIIIIIAGIFLFYFIFRQINIERDYEEANIFVSCYDTVYEDNDFISRVKASMDSEEYKNELKSVYGENTFLKLSLETQNPLSGDYGSLLQTHGMVLSDFLIIGKSALESMGAAFVNITDEMLDEYLLILHPEDKRENFAREKIDKQQLEYYYVGGTGEEKDRYGIKISSFKKLKFITDWRTIPSYQEKYSQYDENEQPDDEFYLVINGDSANIGKYGKKSKNGNSQALYLINRFIYYYH